MTNTDRPDSPGLPRTNHDGARPRSVGRWFDDVAAFSVLAVTRPLARLGIHRPPDGWRRLTEIGLRSEASKFALSKFGLRNDPPTGAAADDPGPERRLVERLGAFLRNEPIARCVMRHGTSSSEATSGGVVDLVISYTGMAPLTGAFDPDVPTSDDEAHSRMTAATVVSFAPPLPADAPGRFVAPDFAARPSMPLSALNVICRLAPDGLSADVWVQFHHAAVDGTPAQEMLDRLEAAWGLAEPRATFPTPDAFAPHAADVRLASPPNAEREVWLAQDFVDFRPLLALRQNLLDRPDVRAGGGITLATLLVWCLGHQREFAGLKFGSTVDVPASADGRSPRGVNFLTIKPAEFFDQPNKSAAMVAYAHNAAHLLGQTRLRRSPPCAATDLMALLPAGLQLRSIRNHLDLANDTYGTIGVSLLKDAEVFVAPCSDLGFDDGFIAVGSMLLPAADGSVVGAVTVKGPKEKAERYPTAIRRAVARCREYV
jgi:hypothetical protein